MITRANSLQICARLFVCRHDEMIAIVDFTIEIFVMKRPTAPACMARPFKQMDLFPGRRYGQTGGKPGQSGSDYNGIFSSHSIRVAHRSAFILNTLFKTLVQGRSNGIAR